MHKRFWGYLWGKLGYGALLFATALADDSIADALAQPAPSPTRWRSRLHRRRAGAAGSIADALARPAHRTLYRALGEEVMRVAHAGGIAPQGFNGFDPAGFVPSADAAATERSMSAMVAHNLGSAKSHSRVWRDLAVRKRPTEVEPMVGAVVREAARHSIDTPLLARLTAMIHEIEEGRRPLDRANIDALASEAARLAA